MNEPIRNWVPLPAWWIPVWVTLDVAGESTDALEIAVEGMVRAGLRTPADITRALCVDLALVESAVATLLAAGVLEAGERGLAARAEARTDEPVRARPGFVAWDPSTQRPLLQLWLDDELPEPPVAPKGWRLAPWEEPDPYPRPPRDRDVAELLRVLPSAGDLRLFEPRGLGVHEADGGRVRRLRPRSARYRRQAVWAPVEQRVAGPIVWRPTVVPLPEVSTELDPRGWHELLDVVDGTGRESLRAAETECRDLVAPGLLKEMGFTSVRDLRESARREVARELGELPGWDALVRAAEDAVVDERVALAVGGDWRRPVRAWGDVLESLTRAVAVRLRPIVHDLAPRSVPPEDDRRVRPLLGTSARRVFEVARSPRELAELRSQLQRDVDSIGTRVLALGVCVALEPRVRRAYAEVCGGTATLFDALDVAKDERNRAVHPREDDTSFPAAGHRARVLLLCRTLARMEFPEG